MLAQKTTMAVRFLHFSVITVLWFILFFVKELVDNVNHAVISIPKSFHIVQALRQLRQIALEASQSTVTGWGRRPAALRALSQRLSRGFNEALNGFTDEGWSAMGSDGMDDVTILVNSSPGKLSGLNIGYANGFPAVTSGVLCAKASMLLQVSIFYNLSLMVFVFVMAFTSGLMFYQS